MREAFAAKDGIDTTISANKTKLSAYARGGYTGEVLIFELSASKSTLGRSRKCHHVLVIRSTGEEASKSASRTLGGSRSEELMSPGHSMKQTDLQRSVMKYLESRNVLCFATRPSPLQASKSKKAFPEISMRGMADLLAFYQSERMGIIPVWLEVRSRRGRQTPDKKHFQDLVESKKHVYMVVTSVEAVKECLE